MKSIRKAFSVCVMAAATGLAGCAPAHDPALTRVESRFESAKMEGIVARNAPIAWREAEEELNDARVAWHEGKSDREIAHRAYLAEQKLEIAQVKSAAAMERDERASLALTTRDAELARARLRSDYFHDRAMQLEREMAAFRTQRTDRGLQITMGQVVFEGNSSALKPGAYGRLRPLAQYLKEEPQRSVIIEGHTDSTGSAEHNALLSLERANAVRAALVSEGIDSRRITTRGLGAALPVASNNTEAGRLQNRRVEVIIQ